MYSNTKVPIATGVLAATGLNNLFFPFLIVVIIMLIGAALVVRTRLVTRAAVSDEPPQGSAPSSADRE